MSREDAEHRIKSLERTRGTALVQLARHAALPVVLDAPLLHLLRINYFLDPPVSLPYGAEAELLLSPLCTEIDDGLYLIGSEERDLLLRELVAEYGGGRLRDVARLLWEYGERGTPWQARPGLTEAQQLTALSFIDQRRAQSWLKRAQEHRPGPGDAHERWFVAMRQDLNRRAAALQAQEDSARPLPALVELGDALLEVYRYRHPIVSPRVMEAAGLPLPELASKESARQRWQQLVRIAWEAGRIPTVLAVASSEHPNDGALARAIQEHWVRLSPALRVNEGRFETPPPEWEILELHRAAIETTLRGVCLFLLQARQPFAQWRGMGFLISERTILTHKSMLNSAAFRERVPGPSYGMNVLLAFTDHHPARPNSFGFENKTPIAEQHDEHVVHVRVENVEIDESIGIAAITLADAPFGASDRRIPLAIAEHQPSPLVGRKVYVVGYPSISDRRTDHGLVKRIMGDFTDVLRLQPGGITGFGEQPMLITHNCFTLGGNGGSPLVDLESGAVLGLHYAGFYDPSPAGLKKGQAIPLWDLASHPIIREARTRDFKAKGIRLDSEGAEPLGPQEQRTLASRPKPRIRSHGLTGPELRELRNAMVDAFSPESFERMLRFELNKKVENITGSGPLNTVVYKVIDISQMEGWTFDLVRAARIANPGNASLYQVAEKLGLSSTQELQPEALNLEKTVRDGAPFLDISAFRSKLGRLEQQVCSVELNGVGHGNGVLVSPDYILTNQHVISKATKDTKLACRFDFAALADRMLATGITVDVSEIVDSSPPSPNDPNLANGDPTDDELDYALLRLVLDIGNEPAGSGANPDAPVRSWTQLAAGSLNVNDPLLVLQHPQNPVNWKLEPLKLTTGRVLDLVGGGRRLRHDANMLPGSSGSPCFSSALEFVALHHAGGDSRYSKGADYNQAIPNSKIIDRLMRQGVTPFWEWPPPR